MTRLLVRRPGRLFNLVAAAWLAGAGVGRAAEPLHERIDRLIEGSMVAPSAALANDAEFLRRVSLDLCNCIASADATRAFLQDTAPDKRRVLIDRFLQSPQHARRLANFLDVSLMERRADKYVPRADWENWLLQSCHDNKPWDQLVREILAADGIDPARRPPAKFALEREADPHALTRDAGRMFFGRDVQCAQCHDHPNVKDYEQREYYGLLSYFQRTHLVKEANGSYRLGEKPDGDATYQSVFKKNDNHAARPALPYGTEPQGPMNTPTTQSKPPTSRRELLGIAATAGNNRSFNRNIVNRLWALMMGRGLFHPVDLDHPDNPPTHPELLDLLADEFVAMKYDMRAFLRELALTRTYQRSFDPGPELAAQAATVAGRLPALEAEAAKAVQAVEAATDSLKAVRKETLAARDAVDKALADVRGAEATLAGLRKASATAGAALTETQKQVQIKTDAAAALQQALAPAKQAAAKLPADVELKQTVDQLQAKSTQLANDLQALAKTVAAQTTAAKQAADKASAGEKSVAELNAKLAAMDQNAQPAIAKYLAARQALHRATAESARRERDVLLAKSFAAYRTTADALAALQKQAGPAIVEIETARRLHREAADKNAAHQRLIAAAEKDEAALGQKIVGLKAAAEQQQHSASLLTSAAEPLEKGAAGLKDPDLNKAVAVVKQKQTALTATLAATRKQLADTEAAKVAAVAKCEVLRKQLPPLTEAVATTTARVRELEASNKTPMTELEQTRSRHVVARQDLLERLAASFAVAPLKPLTAEQIHWSVFQATGILAGYEAAATAEIDKKQPPTEAQKNDAKFKAQRAIALEREVHSKLAGNMAPYVSLYGGGAGQPQFEFFATADQALFMENGDAIRAWTGPGVTLVQRLAQLREPAAFAQELYLSVFNHPPTAEETAEVVSWLTRHNGPTPAATSELVWAMIASAEFRFNH